jgi:Uma2 family endonuclease
MTADQLFDLPNAEHYELVRGVPRVCEPPGGLHGQLAVRIAARLSAHVDQYNLGTVLVEAGYVLRVGPDTVRGPDVSFLSSSRLPPDQIPESFIRCGPDLAVEIPAGSSRWSKVEERLADYFAAGARIVWVVDPQQHRVIVRYPDRAPRLLAHDSVLEGEDVLPGFRLPLTDLFGSR